MCFRPVRTIPRIIVHTPSTDSIATPALEHTDGEAHVDRQNQFRPKTGSPLPTFFHETIHRPPGRDSFLLFVTGTHKKYSLYPPLHVDGLFAVITEDSLTYLWLSAYLGSQGMYNVFEAERRKGDETWEIGVMAVYKDIPFALSDICYTQTHSVFSIPDAFRTSIPSALHAFSIATFTGASPYYKSIETFPSPTVFVV